MPSACDHLRSISLSVICLTLLFSACGASDPAVSDAAATVTIDMRKNLFDPAKLTVKEGTRVCFANHDTEARWPASNIHPTHDIFPEFDPQRPVRSGDTWCFTFEKAGIWQMHDHLFPELVGTITVE